MCFCSQENKSRSNQNKQTNNKNKKQKKLVLLKERTLKPLTKHPCKHINSLNKKRNKHLQKDPPEPSQPKIFQEKQQTSKKVSKSPNQTKETKQIKLLFALLQHLSNPRPLLLVVGQPRAVAPLPRAALRAAQVQVNAFRMEDRKDKKTNQKKNLW